MLKCARWINCTIPTGIISRRRLDSPLRRNRLREKGVIRGGFGIGYNRLPNAIFLNREGNPPFFARFGICCGNPGDLFNGGRILYAVGTGESPDSYPANPVLGQGINPDHG